MQHIEKLIQNQHFHPIVPDFGFDNTMMKIGEETNEPWKMMLDFMMNHYKYERVENYVASRQQLQEEKERILKKK